MFTRKSGPRFASSPDMITIHCPVCLKNRSQCSTIKKSGFFYRSSDRKSVQRYHCTQCRKYFSSATFNKCFNQKKRHLNSKVARLLVSVVSLRESARVLKINRKTITRKLIFMGRRAEQELVEFNARFPKAKHVVFDDLETFEHTKCKPISIGLMVEEETRRILGFNVARMPAKGLLAMLSVAKYGKRADERPKKRTLLFNYLNTIVEGKSIIKSDECPYYFKYILRHFPEASHVKFKGRASAIVGQGELKKVGFDPLFAINHTCATLRARTCRLIRRTWCTTKKPEMLKLHLAIVCLHHNRNLMSLTIPPTAG